MGDSVAKRAEDIAARRGVEYDLLPWCKEHSTPVMAHSPIEQSRILNDRTLALVGKRHNATLAQAASTWVLRNLGVIAIPKTGQASHVRENAGSLDINLTPEDLAEFDAAFRPPTCKSQREFILRANLILCFLS